MRPTSLPPLMPCLFVEHLTVIDFAYLDVQRGLVGESLIVDVELEGELDDQSMVLDFSTVKKQLKRDIDASVDHSLVVPMTAGELSIDRSPTQIELLFRADFGGIEHRSPPQAVTGLASNEYSAAHLATYLQTSLAASLPPSVAQLRLQLRPEVISGAYYHYVHGLRKHDGACQRIAHGHRSRLEVKLDGERNTAVENKLALVWTDIYLGTLEDIVARGNGRLRYRYRAREGEFELALPENRCFGFDGDTTVERIAAWLADSISAANPGREVEVRSYEGVHKGAMARRSD